MLKKVVLFLLLFFLVVPSVPSFAVDHLIQSPTGKLILNSQSTINNWTPFLSISGTSSTPAFGFANSTNTGIYSGSTGQINMCVAGSNSLILLSNGKIDPIGGFGTTTDGAASATTSGLVTTGTQTFAGNKVYNGTIDPVGGFGTTTDGAASATTSGLVTTGVQTFAGNKTFNGTITATGGFGAAGYATTSAPGILAQIKAPTQTIYLSGSGTYTVPASVVWLRVRMLGGGGGGAGSVGDTGTTVNGGPGGNGSNTYFGANTANGGSGGLNARVSTVMQSGGSCSIANGNGFCITGAAAIPPLWTQVAGCNGLNSWTYGASTMFGIGAITPVGYTSTGQSPSANTGAGGSGGGAININCTYLGGGGSAGGYMEVKMSNLSSTYSYGVGSGGVAGTAGVATYGGWAGGAGGSGIIIIEEYYY